VFVESFHPTANHLPARTVGLQWSLVMKAM